MPEGEPSTCRRTVSRYVASAVVVLLTATAFLTGCIYMDAVKDWANMNLRDSRIELTGEHSDQVTFEAASTQQCQLDKSGSNCTTTTWYQVQGTFSTLFRPAIEGIRRGDSPERLGEKLMANGTRMLMVDLDPVEDMETYVINLDRNRASRLTPFLRAFQASDLAPFGFHRQSAIDGTQKSRGELWSMMTQQAWIELEQSWFWRFRLKHYQLTKGGVGCYLSHVALWERFLEDSDRPYALVFEDDALVDRDMLQLLQQQLMGGVPADFDFLMLDCHCNNCTDRGRYREVKHFWGTHAYLATREGIRKLLDDDTYVGTNMPGLFPIAQQIDHVMGDLARAGKLKICAVDRRLRFVKTLSAKSDIQIRVRKVWGYDPFEPVTIDLTKDLEAAVAPAPAPAPAPANLEPPAAANQQPHRAV